MKQFAMIFKNSVGGDPPSPEQVQQLLNSWVVWMDDMKNKGVLADPGNRLAIPGKILSAGGLVTDALSLEVKEAISGYTLIHAERESDAVKIASACPILKVGGSVEVKEVIPMGI